MLTSFAGWDNGEYGDDKTRQAGPGFCKGSWFLEQGKKDINGK
ncbi:MAG: hypothetical protein M2R45_03306 [Verrucomicrobia subdivision 3 bacterium]|nr:hypothetical protein [Limisphaerales bacterium]MCS1415416.1 hypothetical protein [Limisphaerales bacterium]